MCVRSQKLKNSLLIAWENGCKYILAKNELIEVTIFVPVTRPYSEQELAGIPFDQAHTKKVVGEDHLATIRTDNRQELKSKILYLCIKHQPNPILIKLNTTLGRTFIVDATSSIDSNLLIVDALKTR